MVPAALQGTVCTVYLGIYKFIKAFDTVYVGVAQGKWFQEFSSQVCSSNNDISKHLIPVAVALEIFIFMIGLNKNSATVVDPNKIPSTPVQQ